MAGATHVGKSGYGFTIGEMNLFSNESLDDWRFMGTLDPSKLNAGFAGMNLEVDLLPEQISQLHGLQVNVAKTDTWVAILL